MKPILIAVVMAIGAGGIYVAYERLHAPTSATNEVKVETVEVEVETLQKRISDAQEARKADIEAKAKEAYDQAVSQALLEIELEVTATYRKEIEAREKELQQQSTAY
jgi:hypothetical protein